MFFQKQLTTFIIFKILVLSSIGDFHSSPTQFCDQTSECLLKIRRMVQETNRFWFGDQWRYYCGQNQIKERQRHMKNTLDCLNPAELAPFTSLGSRLFRVHTFTLDYLANLRIFPQIHFRPRSGYYRACSHNFDVNITEDDRIFGLSGHPLGRPIPSFQAQLAPNLNWPELHANQSLVILLLDPGWGRLLYLAIDFPINTKVLVEFQPVTSFRLQQPSPLAVLVFELKTLEETKRKILNKWRNPVNQKRENFDLVDFMLEMGLEKSLIGLNWALIGADPFSIEKERLEGIHDNCHSLLLQKLITDQRWHFVQTFPLSTEMDSSLSVSFIQQKGSLNACCHFLENREENKIFLDPLADLQIPTNSLLNGLPTVTSMRPIEMTGEPAYQRASRHYIVFRDERFSLLLIDPNGKKLYWLIVDISAEGLNSGNFADSITVANYIPPIPNKPGECLYAVFMLFRQPKAVVEPLADFYDFNHPLRQNDCKEELCEHRMDFDIEQFKSIHRLQFSAINWAKICFDLFEAARQISIIRKRPEIAEGIDRTAKTGGKNNGRGRINFWNTKSDKLQQIEEICEYFPPNNGNNYQSDCLINEYSITTSSAKRIFNGNGILLIFILMFWSILRRILMEN